MSGDTHPMTEASSVPANGEGVSAEGSAVEDTGSPSVGETLPSMGEDAAGDARADAEADESTPALEQRLATLQAENDTLRSQYMRIAADFDNFRKRQSRDQEDLRLQITCSTLSEILPVVDNFDRARQQLNPQSEEAQTLHRSYQGLYKQLVDVFKQLGVSPMRVEGEPFDPSLHEAVMREPSDEHPEDVVVAELQRGYHLNGRVLRHALVKVSMGPGPSSDSEPREEQGG
ncbi:nucleotide exchange factor GrpE [Synechococcus sp. CCY9201]|uniref:nucleotide exchange factor GrpE n=2 Tax=Synechococcus TaxID=1129 RepID=UPI001E5C721F|nr:MULTISPECIES: nucleotide exchange factor GrpE [unclassified Synechococcus]MEA5423485.1 nucleotide exchange factor GrpE [Synechococcus sp. CCY9202]MEA5475804.1 nucleotide exchange factor GrpE [Synechococcus sp. CCY9201]CAK6686963.1 Protein GrpE [Synechococcus sp. CBW1107]